MAQAEEDEEKEEVVAEEGPEMIRNVWGEMVEKPRYGGKMTFHEDIAQAGAIVDWTMGEAWSIRDARVCETLWRADYSKREYGWDGRAVPLEALRGQILESWEMPDDTTLVFHVRQGIYWHDKPPMNGREFIAEDVAYNYRRYFAMGEFEGGNPHVYAGPSIIDAIVSIEATDKWTVVIKIKQYQYDTVMNLANGGSYHMLPPELIEQEGGSIDDWRLIVGTGPYEFTDYVEGSSWSYTRNPNYWDTDPRYPGAELQLPYADRYDLLLIPEFATSLAALRTGRLDILSPIPVTHLESIARTNPELVQFESWGYHVQIALKTDETPFDDIRVRKAMSMALDLEEINETYYKGVADIQPTGVVSTSYYGYYFPYEEWPQELKDDYAYDPEGAKQLLAEAGYPNGFKTNYDYCVAWGCDPDLALILQEYWRDIGVEVTLSAHESAAFADLWGQHKYTGMAYTKWVPWNGDPMAPHGLEYHQSDYPWNIAGVSYAPYDELYAKAVASVKAEDRRAYSVQLDRMGIEQHWDVWLPLRPTYVLLQPWIKGYNEGQVSTITRYDCWVDQELKKELGH